MLLTSPSQQRTAQTSPKWPSQTLPSLVQRRLQKGRSSTEEQLDRNIPIFYDEAHTDDVRYLTALGPSWRSVM